MKHKTKTYLIVEGAMIAAVYDNSRGIAAVFCYKKEKWRPL